MDRNEWYSQGFLAVSGAGLATLGYYGGFLPNKNSYRPLENSIEQIIVSSSGEISVQSLQELQQQVKLMENNHNVSKTMRTLDRKLQAYISNHSSDETYQQSIKQELREWDDELDVKIISGDVASVLGIVGLLAICRAGLSLYQHYRLERE